MHQRVYTDPEIFDAEMDYLRQCRLFVACKPYCEPGQYVTAHMAIG